MSLIEQEQMKAQDMDWYDLEKLDSLRKQAHDLRAKYFKDIDPVWAVALSPFELTRLPRELFEHVMDIRGGVYHVRDWKESKKECLMQAFIILQELGEHEVSNELLRASKRLGEKLGTTQK